MKKFFSKIFIVNLSWTAIQKIINTLLNLFFVSLFARYFSVDEFGIFFHALSLFGMFAIFAKFGLEHIIVQRLVLEKSDHPRILSTGLVINISSAILVGLLFLIFIFFYSSENSDLRSILLILTLAFCFQTLDIVRYYFEHNLMLRIVIRFELGLFIIFTAIKVIAVIYDYSVIDITKIFLIEHILRFFSYLFILFKHQLPISFSYFSLELVRELFPRLFTLVLLTSSVIILMRIDQIMLKSFFPAESLGFYMASSRVFELISMIPALFLVSAYPAVLEKFKKDRSYFLKGVQEIANILVKFSLVTILLVYIFGDLIIVVLFGERYLVASNLLIIQILGLSFISFGILSGKILITMELEGLYLRKFLMGLLIHPFLAFFLLNYLNIYGIILSNLIVQIFINFIFDIFYIRSRFLVRLHLEALLEVPKFLINYGKSK